MTPASDPEKSIHANSPDVLPFDPAPHPGLPVNLHPSPLMALCCQQVGDLRYQSFPCKVREPLGIVQLNLNYTQELILIKV
jgi:hypothetical protein